MKGYVIDAGYMGYVDGQYMLFANEDDYRDYMNDQKKFENNKKPVIQELLKLLVF